MKVFLDANILFSASDQKCNIARFVRFLNEKGVAFTSDYAAAEAHRNIASKRPQWMSGYDAIMENVQLCPGIDRPVSVPIADADHPILATAIREGCTYLVTGDHKDFGHLFGQTINGIKIVTIPRCANPWSICNQDSSIL
jgi:rRNA-processing protein FCF1